ncbi:MULTISPECIES: YcnI family protein [unclassified Rathayibacter]|uniref:YcnI family copper-binding membrane protein n=1 Tax=unclassified Rathayibacter TaxID=2609250 RepID=UPI00188BDEF9|nr:MULTISPECIES: YcnI family protein [unclassified Rathayibacter]MBF4461474.1 YcnI family protein [Rathayibacter sp. VKM Ac-2879]MBF4502885.1 YcnI family protein [Rathayibacter sp. VKM Ac-2878]
MVSLTSVPSASVPSSARSRLRLVGSGVLVTAGSLTLALSAPAAASAHVTAAATSTAAGSYTVVTFSLAHGCNGSPTTALAITLPDGINSVSPTVNPNWDVVKNEVDITNPTPDSQGNTATKRVSDVVYTAKTPLADGYRDTVSLQLQLPEDAVGKTLEFPVLQNCEVGSTSWDQPTVEGQDEPEHPAPTVAVRASAAISGHHDSDGDGDEATATTASSTPSGSGDDVLARVLGVGGLVVGAVGVAVALASRRRGPKASA